MCAEDIGQVRVELLIDSTRCLFELGAGFVECRPQAGQLALDIVRPDGACPSSAANDVPHDTCAAHPQPWRDAHTHHAATAALPTVRHACRLENDLAGHLGAPPGRVT
jgi:hypothetical protein